MTGADIIAVIILIALGIAIAVYLMHWLYRRSSKEIAFVRTGLGGEKVVLSGGAFVLPIIHNVTTVGMSTLHIPVKSMGEKSLITSDRMRVELIAEFYVKVMSDESSVALAAQSLGKRTMDADSLKGLVQGRFIDALGIVAAKMTMDEMQKQRGVYVKEVKILAEDALTQTGLILETVSLTGLDQADKEIFNPSNAFDAEGLTQLTELIEDRKKVRNDIEQDTAVMIRDKNLEAEKLSLTIEQESHFARLAQEREISVRRANERSQTDIEKAKREREAEEAKIEEEKIVEMKRIDSEEAIEVERALTETELTQEIENRRKLRNQIEKDAEVEIHEKNLATERITLDLAKESEFINLQQQQEIAIRKAQQKETIVFEESERYEGSEKAQIKAQEEVRKAQIEQQKVIDAVRIVSEQKTEVLAIEKRKKLEVEDKERKLAVIERSIAVLKANAEEEVARAAAVDAEQSVHTVRELMTAERKKGVDLLLASQQAEHEAIKIVTISKAEKEAAAEREIAEQHASMAAKLRYETEAEGELQLNEAENIRNDASRETELRMEIARNLDSIIRESVKPMENIDAIKVLDVSGMPGFSNGGSGGLTANSQSLESGGDGDAKPGSANLADNVVNSALRYRAHMPFVDNLLGEIGMSPGEMSNISNILGNFDKKQVDGPKK